MFPRIRFLSPDTSFTNESPRMARAQGEVEVLVCVAGDEDVVSDTFAVVCERAPAVAMEEGEEGKGGAVNFGSGIGGR